MRYMRLWGGWLGDQKKIEAYREFSKFSPLVQLVTCYIKSIRLVIIFRLLTSKVNRSEVGGWGRCIVSYIELVIRYAANTIQNRQKATIRHRNTIRYKHERTALELAFLLSRAQQRDMLTRPASFLFCVIRAWLGPWLEVILLRRLTAGTVRECCHQEV